MYRCYKMLYLDHLISMPWIEPCLRAINFSILCHVKRLEGKRSGIISDFG